jgi:hypothetical protein
MSAGICIMNKNAIAMAADSAVTIGQHAAIHNSANKLFALSKYEPIGAIIYANAEFMRIPMEIIIKEYKRTLGKKCFDTLNEYVQDFVMYLEQNVELYHFDSNEEHYVNQVFINLLNGLALGYERRISDKVDIVQRELTQEELEEVALSAYNETIEFIDAQKELSTPTFSKYVEEKYAGNIAGYISAKFKWLSEEQAKTLEASIYSVYDRQFLRGIYVGMAIAGYGRKDIFPHMYHIHLGGMINGSTRYVIKEDAFISEKRPATISPFAQTDVMQTFLFGINDSVIQDMANEIPRQIDKKIQSLNDSLFSEGNKGLVQKEISGTTPNIIQQIAQKANEKYMQPILQSVATLPIEELALLAESMINITSIRRKVALDDNIGTVGGPIDVAIISKGDGLVWMKRKHYFDIAHNLQYAFTRYAETQEPHRREDYEEDKK